MTTSRAIPLLLPCLLWCGTIFAIGQAVDEDAPPPPAWTDAPLRVDVGTGTLVLTPTDGPRETGLPIRFTVRMEGDGDVSPAMPLAGTEMGDFEVVPCGSDILADSAIAGTSGCWAIRTFGSGDLILPAFEVRLADRAITVPARSLRIASVVGEDAGLDAYRDIVDTVSIDRPFPLILWFAVGTGILLAAALVLYLVWRSRRPKKAAPPIPADAWALRELNALAAQGLPASGQIQTFFIRLTDVVRRFMERRYDISAPELTTREFIGEAERHPRLAAEQAAMLGNLLRSADLVKFAGDRPATNECDHAFEVVRAFVVSVGPKPSPDATTGHRDAPTPASNHASDRIHAADRRREVDAAVAGLDELEEDQR